MITEYIMCYFVYLSVIIIGFVYGKKMGAFKCKFPLILLLTFPTKNIILAIILGCEAIAAYMDIKNNMDVFDMYHYTAYMAIVIGIIVTVTNEGFIFFSYIRLYDLLPLIFVLITVKTRGFSDTLAMVAYCTYALYTKTDALFVLIAIFASYLLQILIQIIHCKKIHIKFKKHEHLPFLPALYIGHGVIFTIATFL